MPVVRFNDGADASEIRALSPEPPQQAVAEIIAAVRDGGDAAVLELEQRFGAALSRLAAVPESEFEAAVNGIDADLVGALKLAIANVRAVAEAQLQSSASVELAQGQSVEYRQIPVRRAGLYVPGGRGSYPSTAIMAVTAAVVAGVDEVVVVSPAREGGMVDPAVLTVCRLLGVSEVYPIGGAQAVAALALGTETIDPVEVIVGPGNSYVQEAKRQLYGTVGIDSVAGPSELVVIADGSADAAAVAADLLAQGEHGPDSLVALVSTDQALLDDVSARCAEITAEMALVQVPELYAAVSLADSIAPEHLQIIASRDIENELASQVRNAGCLFVGANAATAFGDYVAGSNHVLPTGGSARFASALSVHTFRRRMATVRVPDDAVGELADAGARIARAEGFEWHAKSMEVRKK